jgi:hypothetical protein
VNALKQIIVFSILFCLIQTSLKSCDCIPTSEKFTDNLAKRQLVIHAKVVQQVPYTNQQYKGHGFYGITKLAIIHSFKGKLWTDTLIHINTSPSLCGSSIQQLEQNQEVFLKAFLVDEFNIYEEYYNNNGEDSKTDTLISTLCKKHQNINTDACDVSILPVNKGKASGRITYSISKQWKKYNRLEKSNPERAEKYFAKHIRNKDTDQKISVSRMYSIIDKQVKANR